MADFARSQNRKVQDQLDRLAKLSPGGDRLGLDRITLLLDRLGRPQDRLPPVLHVAGTNGKGSTCAFLHSILESAGFTVHMFTSPHLVRFNERIRIAGKLIEDDELSALLEEVLDASDGIEPSFFEVTTAVAFLAFARTPASACILEVGLGGRLDATNVVDQPLVCGIAGLGIDHRQWLGKSIAEIAGEKAAIAKHGVPLVTQRYPPPAARRVQEISEAAGAPRIGRGALWDSRVIRGRIHYRDRLGAWDLPMPTLPGRYQAENAALAVAMLRHQKRFAIPDEALAEGLRSAKWPARLQRLSQGPLARQVPKGSELWLDGGHNASAARLVADHVRRSFSDDLPFVLLFASLKTKSPRTMLKCFRGLAGEVHTLPVPFHDHYSPDALAKLAREIGFEATSNSTLEQALGRIERPSRVLIFGSLYLAGEILRANREIPD
jgi:dihydrofolate synthase/folylpolyglutamate synthase